jgi:hypothetical protein
MVMEPDYKVSNVGRDNMRRRSNLDAVLLAFCLVGLCCCKAPPYLPG